MATVGMVRATIWRETCGLVRADAPFYLSIFLYAICTLLLLEGLGAREQATYAIYVKRWALLFLFLLPAVSLSLDAIRIVHRFDRRRGLAMRRAFSPPRMAQLFGGMTLLTTMVLFQGSFTSIKNVLPLVQRGFPFDGVQADIDRWLHFGTDPWRWLFVVGESAPVRAIVEWNYNVMWFVFCFGALFFVATSPCAASIRRRYLAAFMLTWVILGNVLAGLLLSAGPAFYGEVTGDETRFAEQLAFLAGSLESSHSAAAYQDYLWSLYKSGQSGFGSGISAFPSVHVGLIALNAFFLAEYSRRWGIAAFAYLALIVASSVYLGWHYAIDGYAAILIVAAIHLTLKRAIPLPSAALKQGSAEPAETRGLTA